VLTEFPKVEQGSEQWHDLRRGIVTASVVGKLLTPTLKVADNDTSRALTATLVAERLTGWTEDTPMTSDMWRGVDSEPIARDIYSGHYSQAEETGFLRLDEDGWTLGFSPDGLVGTDGLLEIKAPRAKTHLRTILADEVPAYYMPQLMAGLLVSGRDWIDFCSYVGGMPLYTKRVYPDPEWFEAIRAACVQFEKKATALMADYYDRVKNLPATDRRVELEMVI
jgi:putative phage-type endonuclease